MKCIVCGKEYDDGKLVCPYCAGEEDGEIDFEIIDMEIEEDDDFEATEESSEEVLLLIDEDEDEELPPTQAFINNNESPVVEVPIEELQISSSEDANELKLEEIELAVEETTQSEANSAVKDETEELELEYEQLDIVEEPDRYKMSEQSDPSLVTELDFEAIDDSYETYEIKIKVREYKTNELMTDFHDIKETLMDDKRRIFAMFMLFVGIIGSFLPFWGINDKVANVGSYDVSTLIVGYGFGGMFGKICVLFATIAILCMFFNLSRTAFKTAFIACFALAAQAGYIFAMTFVSSWEYAGRGSVYFAYGFYVVAVGLLIGLLLCRKVSKPVVEESEEE